MFKEFRKIVKQRHEYARDWKKRTGGKVIGYFCTNVPEPLIYAAGILPVRIMGTGESTIDAEKYIHPMWCSFCRDCFAQGLRGHYDYLDGIVNANGCQHMRQAYLSWIKNIPSGYTHEIARNRQRGIIAGESINSRTLWNNGLRNPGFPHWPWMKRSKCITPTGIF